MKILREALNLLKKKEARPKSLGAIAREHMHYPMPSTMINAYKAVVDEARSRGDTRSDESLFYLVLMERMDRNAEIYQHDPEYAHRESGMWEEIMMVGKELNYFTADDTVESIKRLVVNQMRATSMGQVVKDRA